LGKLTRPAASARTSGGRCRERPPAPTCRVRTEGEGGCQRAADGLVEGFCGCCRRVSLFRARFPPITVVAGAQAARATHMRVRFVPGGERCASEVYRRGGVRGSRDSSNSNIIDFDLSNYRATRRRWNPSSQRKPRAKPSRHGDPLRPETCLVSTGGGTRRVQSVRERGGGRRAVRTRAAIIDQKRAAAQERPAGAGT
jgi:hypothetical protein